MFPSSSFVSSNSPRSSLSKNSLGSCQLSKNSANLVHKQLEDEAEKLRQWRLQTELDLKERANQVEELTKTNDRLNRELNEEKQRSGGFRSHNQCLKQDLDGLEGVIGDAKKTIECMKTFAKKVRDSRERGEMAVARVEEENNANREDLKKISTELEKMQTSLKSFGEAYQTVTNEKSDLMKSAVQFTEQLNLTNSELSKSENEKNELFMAFSSSKQELDILQKQSAQTNAENEKLFEKCCLVLSRAEMTFELLVSTTLEKNNLNEIVDQVGLDLIASMQYGLELWVILENCFGKYLSEVNSNTFVAETLCEVVKFLEPGADSLNNFMLTLEDNLRGFQLAQKQEVESFSSKLVESAGFISHLFDLWMGEIEKRENLKVLIDACYVGSTSCISKLEQKISALEESLKDGEKDSKEKIVELETSKRELTRKTESLQESLEEKDLQILALQNDSEKSKNEVALLQSEVVAKDEENFRLDSSLKLIQVEKEKLMEDLNELRAFSNGAAENFSRDMERKTCDFEARELSLVSEVSELHRVTGELRCEKEEARKLANQVQIENESLRSQLSAVQLGAEEQGKNINALEKLREDFETKIELLKGENFEMVGQVSQKTKLLEEVNEKEKLLSAKLEQMEEGIESFDLKLKENQVVIEDLRNSNIESKQRIAELEAEKVGISEEVAKVCAEREKLLQEVESLQLQMTSCQSDLAAGEKFQSQVLKLNEENARLQECLNTTRTNLGESEAKIAELEQNISLSGMTIQRLEGDTRDLCQKMQFQVFKKQCVENEKNELQKTLNKVLQDRDRMLLEANSEIKGLQDMNASLKQEVSLLKEENEKIKSEINVGNVGSQNLSQAKARGSKGDNQDQDPGRNALDPGIGKLINSDYQGESFNQNGDPNGSKKDSDLDDLAEDDEDGDDDEDPFVTLGLAVQPDFLNEQELINQAVEKSGSNLVENEVEMETSTQVKTTPRSSPRIKNKLASGRADSVERVTVTSSKSRKNARSASPRRRNVEKNENIPLVRQSPNQVLKNKDKVVLSTPAVVKMTPASFSVSSQSSSSVFRVGNDKLRKTPAAVLPSKTLFENLVKAKAFANYGTGGYGTPRTTVKDVRTPNPKRGSPLANLTSQIEDISLSHRSEKSGTKRARSASCKKEMSGTLVNDSMRMLECAICLNYPKNTAQESLCCSQVICKTCVNKVEDSSSGSSSVGMTNGNDPSKVCCPLCNQQFETSPVKGALKRIIDNVSIACENGCGVTLMLGKISEHEKVCVKKILICNFCDGSVSRENFVDHLALDHGPELTERCSSLSKSDLAVEIEDNSRRSTVDGMELFKPSINSAGRYAKLGPTGKFYCESQVEFACPGCNRKCGPNDGCNCVACQKLDIKARNLPRGFYVNKEGCMSYRDVNKNSFFCLRTVPITKAKTKRIIVCDGSSGFRCESCVCLNKAWSTCPAFRELNP